MADKDEPAICRLSRLFEACRLAGLKFGARERIAATIVGSEYVHNHNYETLDDLRPILRPVLAKTKEEQELFDNVFFDFSKKVDENGTGIHKNSSVNVSRKWVFISLFLVLHAIIVFFYFRPPDEPPNKEPTFGHSEQRDLASDPPEFEIQSIAKMPNNVMNLVAEGAQLFEGAPTLRELGAWHAANRRTGSDTSFIWTGWSFARRISELTGLPENKPLRIFDGDGLIWAKVALAFSRLEDFDAGASFEELKRSAGKALGSEQIGNMPIYRLAEEIRRHYPGLEEKELSSVEILNEIREERDRKNPNDLILYIDSEGIDKQTIQRALAMGGVEFSDNDNAPWNFAKASSEAEGAPEWIAWAAMVTPLAIAVVWFSQNIGYLRRRRPETPHARFNLNLEYSRQDQAMSHSIQRAAKWLLNRTPTVSATIDPEATIKATILAGGHFLTPVPQTIRNAPEYLVLIERIAMVDQEAERLYQLVVMLRDQVSVEIFFYHAETSFLISEIGRQRTSIQQLYAKFPEHRLIILGSGRNFIEPVHCTPRVSALQLMSWSYRVLLTPIPVSGWTNAEFVLARALDIPIGRATSEGILAFAERLATAGFEDEELVDPSGDDLNRPMPSKFGSNSHDLLYNRKSSDHENVELLRQLHNYLDGPTFEWLCALAVFPILRWDLTLYLGVTVPENVTGLALLPNSWTDVSPWLRSVARRFAYGVPDRNNDDGPLLPVYSERRVAALTQLPWLRHGHMPDWARRLLIAEIPRERLILIRRQIRELIKNPEYENSESNVALRINKEHPRERLDIEDFFDDEIFVDFITSRRGDGFPLSPETLIQKFREQRWFEKIGPPTIIASLIVVVWAFCGWYLAPKPLDGPLVRGAYVPLLALALGAVMPFAACFPLKTYSIIYDLLFRSSEKLLAIFIFLCLLIFDEYVQLSKSIYGYFEAFFDISPLIDVGFSAISIATVFGACASIALATSRRIGLPSEGMDGVSSGVIFNKGFLVSLSIMWALVILFRLDIISFTAIVIINLIVSIVWIFGWFFIRFMPVKLIVSRSSSLFARQIGSLSVVVLSLAPIVLGLWIEAILSQDIRLEFELPEGGTSVVAQNASGTLVVAGSSYGDFKIAEVPGKIWTIDTGFEGEIAALAIRGELADGGNIWLGVAYQDGRIRKFDGRSGEEVKVPMFDKARELAGAPHLAIGPAGEMVVAIEDAVGSRLISSFGASNQELSAPVSNLASSANPFFVIATMDGAVSVFDFRDADDPKFHGEIPQQGFRPRFLKVGLTSADEESVTLVSDNGAVLTGTLSTNNRLEFDGNEPSPALLPLDLNDVSILLAPPQDDADPAIAITDLKVAGDDVWSDEAFGAFRAIAGHEVFGAVAAGEASGNRAARIGISEFSTKADWHIASIRVDPGAPGLSSEIAAEFGQSPQIRLVLQPITGGEVRDVAAHLIFNFTGSPTGLLDGCLLPKFAPDGEAFQAVLDDIIALKRRLAGGEIGDQEIDTSGDLSIHPAAASAATQTAFHAALIAFLEKHLHPQRLSAMAITALPQGAPEPWIFVAMARAPNGDFVPVPSPALKQNDRPRFAQMLDVRSGALVAPEVMPNNLNPITCKFEVLPDNSAGSPANPEGVSTAELFPNGSAARMQEIVAVIADPTRSHFFNTDCVSCHTETRREMDILGTDSVDAPVDPSVLPKELWNVRNFGWFPSFLDPSAGVAATVTRRTATETMEVVEAINARLRTQ